MTAPIRSLVLGVAAIGVFGTVAPVALAAQQDPRLVTAVRLAQDGLSDSARAVAGRIMQATQPADSLYPEVLYTMGLLAATEQDRRLYLKKVVVDHALSDWADDALLQLVQLDYGAGNTEAAVRQAVQLVRDYPSSPIVANAAFWGARAAGDRRDPPTACRLADAGLAAVGGDVELKNLLDFQKQRCQGLAALAQDTARNRGADSAALGTTSRPASPAPAAARGFFVQVSAVKTQAAANVETARIRRAGYTAVIAREAGFMKIRAGAFGTRAEADKAAADIRAKLGGRPFVVRVP
ncbi:MAG: SPOR domain-containing protein [Gemmatimonadales bacterium]|nr:SPOR domain-containing protein [Gemmatimonadales bacterium]